MHVLERKGDFSHMISDEQLDAYRISGEKIRVVRDGLESNDVKGIVLAWDESQVMIRRPNKRVVKLDRNYIYQPFAEPRQDPENI
ncbi:hypothetical protein SAMN05216191_101326 [Paenibacillus jilunlii]|uniref:Uncharacterized protein n=2 Tax=Paenibacillus jilunlii TaxID=682956 RepID=A0A1G9GCS9_9BACL|nr:hypothetical protein SAMN05216191_101326 [Paenibacillus jilunlii]